MQDEIDLVSSGLQTFATEVASQDIDGRFWVILTGSTPSSGRRTELVIGGDNGIASTSDLRTGFGKIRATYAVSGFQEARGGQEAPFEAARMALGEAPYNVFDHKNVGGTGVLKLRPDARKFMMMLTDEDADSPLYPANFEWGFTSFDIGPTSWPSYVSGKYAEDLKATITALVQNDVTLYMFVNPNSGVSRKQFGDPSCDKSAADFSNFDRQATIDCLSAAGLTPSLVGGLLARGKTARIFNVVDIAKPGFVQNFFVDAVRTVAKCQLRKRQAADPSCVTYRCSSTRGCYIEYLCATGCDQCKIGTQCYRAFDQNPAKTTSCEFCIPSKSKTAWSACSGSAGTCKTYGCLPNFGYCGVEDVCTAACDRCNVGGACFKKDAANADNVCLKCVPSLNQTAFSDTCPKCTPECKNGGVCAGTTTRKCNCEGTNMLGAACDQAPVCAKPCKNNAPCVVVDYATGKTQCQCEGTGFKGEDCAVCDPDQQPCAAVPKTCEPKCANGGVCNDGACNCAGTGHEGAQCQTKSALQCLPACANGGRCDTTQGRCDCTGLAFEGAQCQTPKATAAPGSTPVDKEAVCQARCSATCGANGVQTCACDSTTNDITVTCKTSNDDKCKRTCDAACPAGAESCLCDQATGEPQIECILTQECRDKCDAACPSKLSTQCKCDVLTGKMIFMCEATDAPAPLPTAAAHLVASTIAILAAALALMLA